MRPCGALVGSRKRCVISTSLYLIMLSLSFLLCFEMYLVFKKLEITTLQVALENGFQVLISLCEYKYVKWKGLDFISEEKPHRKENKKQSKFLNWSDFILKGYAKNAVTATSSITTMTWYDSFFSKILYYKDLVSFIRRKQDKSERNQSYPLQNSLGR